MRRTCPRVEGDNGRGYTWKRTAVVVPVTSKAGFLRLLLYQRGLAFPAEHEQNCHLRITSSPHLQLNT